MRSAECGRLLAEVLGAARSVGRRAVLFSRQVAAAGSGSRNEDAVVGSSCGAWEPPLGARLHSEPPLCAPCRGDSDLPLDRAADPPALCRLSALLAPGGGPVETGTHRGPEHDRAGAEAEPAPDA